VFARVGAECAEAGLPFAAPEATPNTAMALEVAEAVRRTTPGAFPALHRRLFGARFVDGLDLGDERVVEDLAAGAGADLEAVRAWRSDGRSEGAVAEARVAATEIGVTATPALRFDSGLVITGVHPRASLARWVTRMQARSG
jgi:predicted DsbA family dithiol-disulfide isomerase